MSKQKPNLNREIKTLKGETYPMSFPSQSDLDKIKATTGKEDVKIQDLPKESVGNVIINSLSAYEVADRKEVFLVNQVANWALSEPTEEDGFGELKEKLYTFLIERVLPQATIRETIENETPGTENKKKGVYMPWVIAQVYDELGVTE